MASLLFNVWYDCSEVCTFFTPIKCHRLLTVKTLLCKYRLGKPFLFATYAMPFFSTKTNIFVELGKRGLGEDV